MRNTVNVYVQWERCHVHAKVEHIYSGKCVHFLRTCVWKHKSQSSPFVFDTHTVDADVVSSVTHYNPELNDSDQLMEVFSKVSLY